MPGPVPTAKIKLVTIIATSELEERLVDDLHRLGAGGYTVSRASGGGLHGPRTRGLWDTGNVRVEALVTAEVGTRVLQNVARTYEGMSIVAFMQDVEAVPAAHFASRT
ncbi:MAG TPA: hypothetical protein VIF09_23030 [Polyangiaceae bacterium]|jgi:nitrogen regulatory protein P-II 2